MYTGHDPDNVAKGGAKPDSTLAKTSVPAPKVHYGSVMPFLEGETSIEFNGIKLDEAQVCGVASF